MQLRSSSAVAEAVAAERMDEGNEELLNDMLSDLDAAISTAARFRYVLAIYAIVRTKPRNPRLFHTIGGRRDSVSGTC